MRRLFLCFLCVILAAGLLSAAFLLIHGGSPAAILYELRLKRAGGKERYTDPDRLSRAVAESEQEPAPEVPEGLGCAVEIGEYGGRTVFTLIPGEDTDTGVLYLHGGAYLTRANRYVWDFCDRLAAAAQVKVILPDYATVPNGTVDDAFDLLVPLWEELCSSGREPVLMGDSAGGGLAAALAGEVGASSLVLISPWLDGTLAGDEVRRTERKDVLLGADGLRELARLWAGSRSPEDPRISPLNGKPEGLKRVLILSGTRDILYPACRVYAGHLAEEGIDCTLVVKRGLFHDYALCRIPEGEEALQMISSFLGEQMLP